MAEFDYQWANLLSKHLYLNEANYKRFLDLVQLPPEWFEGKTCLDVGCGSGRWTWAMMQCGAKVVSIDVSEEAVKICKDINPDTIQVDIMTFVGLKADFVLCWGVLHHLPDPYAGFKKIAKWVKPGGRLHIMVYHKRGQKVYKPYRKLWPTLDHQERLTLCYDLLERYKGKHRIDLHGWWDALNPKYNWSYRPWQIRRWFWGEGFRDVRLMQRYNINMQGVKK